MLVEAQALEKEGKIQEALDKYRDAYELNDGPSVQIELAFAQARAGLHLPCARHIQDLFAFWSARDFALHTLDEVRSVHAYCKKHVGTIVPRVNIPGVRITVDGNHVTDWPFHEELFVEPGKHIVKANASGYWQNQTDVEVKAGEHKTLDIAMQQKVHSQYVAFPAPTQIHFNINANLSTGSKSDQPTWPRNLMVASGIGMGLGAGALALGLVLRSDEAGGQSSGVWTGVAAGGGVLAGISLAGLIIGLANRPDPPPPNVIIQPQIAKDGGGVQVSGAIP
ncbi:PEGA domain-containing protein [Polyangium spumosum]|uniref:PEGA domain-containing protein n=1 Tax=Polyangium spumosum TaxID=889282 RepID=A0A6N7PM05_9BACT|nr:PEGA domain-containing protein [Polyangium spumosum]MRG93048.1 PEGA domain-containing protein [Polyangium spumosum]